jgi:hypothetical protein
MEKEFKKEALEEGDSNVHSKEDLEGWSNKSNVVLQRGV